MHAVSGPHRHLGQREAVRSPIACIAVTIAVSAVFWAGLIWAAVRLYG